MCMRIPLATETPKFGSILVEGNPQGRFTVTWTDLSDPTNRPEYLRDRDDLTDDCIVYNIEPRREGDGFDLKIENVSGAKFRLKNQFVDQEYETTKLRVVKRVTSETLANPFHILELRPWFDIPGTGYGAYLKPFLEALLPLTQGFRDYRIIPSNDQRKITLISPEAVMA